jgi:uncharacterized membrane protein
MNQKKNTATITFRLAIGAVFAALTCVATLVFTVSVPATTGYFNVGETVIYVAALLFGPLVGAFAGGVGAAVADMIVAPQFAPGTLVIKAFEGAIVGFMNKKLKRTSKSSWRMSTAILGAIVGILLAATGSYYYKGEVRLYFGIPPPPPENPTFIVFIPAEIWYFLGVMVALLIILAGFKIDPESGRAVFSMILGGLEMVAGYFLYELLVLGHTTAAVEIPVNVGQMIVGLVVALPIARIILRSLPQLKG